MGRKEKKIRTKRKRNTDPEKIETGIKIVFYILGSVFYLLVVLNILDLLIPGTKIFPWG